jgi:hypothetical protein
LREQSIIFQASTNGRNASTGFSSIQVKIYTNRVQPQLRTNDAGPDQLADHVNVHSGDVRVEVCTIYEVEHVAPNSANLVLDGEPLNLGKQKSKNDMSELSNPRLSVTFFIRLNVRLRLSRRRR